MADFLLDTHTLLWYAQSPALLPTSVTETIQDAQASVYLSRVSLLEIAIKCSIGKLELRGTFQQWLRRVTQIGFNNLEINDRHLINLATLPMQPNHRAPFERLLIAQALTENLALVSRDGKFGDYAGLGLQTR